MEEARAVLARLARIEALEREDAAAPQLLAELRELVREAEAWARREQDGEAIAAVDCCRAALAKGSDGVPRINDPFTSSVIA
jgi:transposase